MAAEQYASNHKGYYNHSEGELNYDWNTLNLPNFTFPSGLPSGPYCDKEYFGYRFDCQFSENGYTITATPSYALINRDSYKILHHQ